jgi:hypothetical protein
MVWLKISFLNRISLDFGIVPTFEDLLLSRHRQNRDSSLLHVGPNGFESQSGGR